MHSAFTGLSVLCEGTSHGQPFSRSCLLTPSYYQRSDVDSIVGVALPDSGLDSPVSEEELVDCGIVKLCREGSQHHGGPLDGLQRPVQGQRRV